MIKILNGQHVVDGAGVKIFRLFSHDTVQLTDPFLLLDYFGSEDPKDYIKGFPWHPHRGIETVTYMIKGDVEHQDNLGHKGVIGPGDVQWMSAGSGIIHQEMPQGLNGMNGFQLWVNMPAKKKMGDPKYRGISSKEIKIVKKDGVEVKIISGEYFDITGPVTDLIIDIVYLDVSLTKDKTFNYFPKVDYTTICYVVSGKGNFSSIDFKNNINAGQAGVIMDVDKFSVKSSSENSDGLQFLLISGKPLREKIAWGGPIVMNTQDELEEAFDELRKGTFIKTK